MRAAAAANGQGGGKSVVLVRRGGGGAEEGRWRGRRLALTCNAVLWRAGQSFAVYHWRGWGHGLMAAKESCRSEEASEREGTREGEIK